MFMVRIFSLGDRRSAPIKEAKTSWLEHSIFPRMKIFLPLHECKHSLFVLYETEMDIICFMWHRHFVSFFVFHGSHCGATFIDSPFNACGMHAIIAVWVIENNEIYRAMERTIQRFHCTTVKMEFLFYITWS